MAKQLIVARGQIEDKGKVIAEQGDTFKPKNAAQEKALLDAGVIAEVGSKRKAATPSRGQAAGSSDSGPGGPGQDDDAGDNAGDTGQG